MKPIKNISIIMLILLTPQVWAYGGGGSSSTKACAKPKFSDFTPVEKSDVSPKAAFSFIASANTYPESIKVTVKGEPVAVKVEDKKGTAFLVSGTLPDSAQNDFVRININADAANNCKGTGGWLLKVGQ